MSAWQLIDSAPKEKVILLYGPLGHGKTSEHPQGPIRAVGYWDEIDEAWALTDTTWVGPFIEPTHWAPVLAKPE